MKKIILFMNGIETLGFFSTQLAKTFRRDGYDVFLFDVSREEESFFKLCKFYEPWNTVAVTFNFTGIRGEDIFYNEQGEHLFNVCRIPCLNIVVDHPFYYHALLKERPHFYHQICIDRFHETYMKTYFPEIPVSFLPLGGTGLPCPAPLKDRRIEILFTGNYTPPEAFDRHINRLGDEYAVFYRSIIDALIKEPSRPMEEVFAVYLKKELGDLKKQDYADGMGNMIFIDLYVRFYFRGLIIKTLADSGLPVHVFGGGWEKLACRHPENLINGGPLTSRQCLKKMRDSRISLNIMPWFKDGAHDRIFNSMLNGAVCVTDGSVYLEEQFTDGQELFFYQLSHIEELPGRMEALLKNPDLLQTVSQAGYEKARLFHAWSCRAKAMEPLIDRLLFMSKL